MKRRTFSFCFFHGLALLGLTPSSFATSARPGVRAVYGVSEKKPPFDTLPIDQIPPWLLQHGINAVFLPATASTAMLQALRQAEIHCFLEVPVFSSRSHYRAHPEWRPITASGEEMKPDGWYHGLCPNQPTLRELRLNEFEKRLRNSLFDGYWLDFIRYPVHWEKKNPRIEDSCFCPECLSRFKAFASLDLPSATPAAATQILERHLPAWVRFRIHTIASWVEDAESLRARLHPQALMGLFLVPWGIEEDGRMGRIVGQDVQALAASIDIFSPMLYHGLCGQAMDWMPQVLRQVRSQTAKPVWPVLQSFHEPGHLSPAQFRQSLKISAESAPDGAILFSASHIQKESRWGDIQALWAGRDAKENRENKE